MKKRYRYSIWKDLIHWRNWKNLKEARRRRKSLTDEEIDRIVFADDKEKFEIFEKAKAIVMNWCRENNIVVNEILFLPGISLSQLYVFFEDNEKLLEYQTTKVTETIQEIFNSSFRDQDFFIMYSSGIRYVFDSYENVKQNYGSYYMYLR